MKVCIARGWKVCISVRIEDPREGAYCSTMEGAEKIIRDWQDEVTGVVRKLVSVNTEEGGSGENKGLAE